MAHDKHHHRTRTEERICEAQAEDDAADQRAKTATILAALRYYQSQGLGDPANRPEAIHDIATDNGELVSLDDTAISNLCESMNLDDAATTPKGAYCYLCGARDQQAKLQSICKQCADGSGEIAEAYTKLTAKKTTKAELSALLATARKVMDGDSNDAEHDALFELVQHLETAPPVQVSDTPHQHQRPKKGATTPDPVTEARAGLIPASDYEDDPPAPRPTLTPDDWDEIETGLANKLGALREGFYGKDRVTADWKGHIEEMLEGIRDAKKTNGANLTNEDWEEIFACVDGTSEELTEKIGPDGRNMYDAG